jgi:uncharacterized protein (UPF0335 family)
MVKKTQTLFDDEGGDDAPVVGDNRSELQSFIDRLQRLDEEKKQITEDMTSIIKEAAKKGYDQKALRRAYGTSKWSAEDRDAYHDMTKRLGLFD